LINFCWYVFKAGLAVALVGAVATGVYLYVRMDDEIRRHVEDLLAARYPQLAVSVGGARLIEGKGIAVYDLSLASPGASRRDDPLLAIDELLLVCDAEFTTLMQGTPAVHRVEVKHPQVSLRRAASGRWNFESLLPLEPCGQKLPQIVIRGGELSIADELVAGSQPLRLGDIEITVTPTQAMATQHAAAAQKFPSLQIEGAAGGQQLKSAKIHATVDGVQRLCTASVVLDQLQINEALMAWARPLLPEAFRATRLGATVDGTITATWQPAGPLPMWAATLAVSGGRIDDPRLARSITELAGKMVVDGHSLRVEQLRGKWGPAAVALSLNRSGWAASAPMALSARAENVPLDEQLHRTLATAGSPPVGRGIPMANLLREQLEKYRPSGVVDATLQASFREGKWKPTASLAGRQLSFESDKFAYRLTDGDGTIVYTPAEGDRPPQLNIDLFAMGGGQRLHIVGQVIDPRPAAAGWVQITGEGLELDERIIAAVDERISSMQKEPARPVIASLHPSGKFNLTYWRIERPQAGAEPRTALRLDLTDVRINYEQFPYALWEIRGVIEAQGNHWTFSNLVSGGRRMIYGEGYLRPGPQGSELWLRFTGQNVPLDDNLFYALQPASEQGRGESPAQVAWKQLKPDGAINLTAEVRHRIGQPRPNIQVAVQPLAKFSLRPEFFSYLLDDVTGTATYNDGQVALHEMKARHDGTSMGANGGGFFSPEGWEFRLTGLWADRITARSDLLSALPQQLSKLIDQLRPNGSFGLHNSELVFRKPASAIASLQTEWDIQLECHQTDLTCGIELHNIHGSVRLQGQSNEQGCYSAGELNLESVTYQDVQLTNVSGPIWVDESQCLLGKWATDKKGPGQLVRRVTGNVYGGTLASDAWVSFGGRPQYGAAASLTGADLSRLIIERFGGQQPFQGKLDGNIILSGEGPQLARLTGEGNVHIRDANIYELPLLMSLLKVLKTGASDKTAFDQSDIAFRIQGPHIYLDQIDFLGEVVDLYGYGETNFNQDVKLIFHAELGPRKYLLPGVKHLVGQASQQAMQMYVEGTLAEPTVRTEAFPQFNQLLKQIRADFEKPTGPAANRQANRTDIFGRPN